MTCLRKHDPVIFGEKWDFSRKPFQIQHACLANTGNIYYVCTQLGSIITHKNQFLTKKKDNNDLSKKKARQLLALNKRTKKNK